MNKTSTLVVVPPQVLRTNFELKIIHTQTHSRLSSSNSRDRTPGFPDRFRAGLKTDTTQAMMRASGSLVMAADDSPIALLHPVFFCILLLPVSSRLIQYSYIHLLHVTTDSVNILSSTPTETSLAIVAVCSTSTHGDYYFILCRLLCTFWLDYSCEKRYYIT
jgi:hypothetical protein